MALTAVINTSVTPATLTVTATAADRAISVTVTSGTQSVVARGSWPVVTRDDSGHVWTPKTDDGLVTVLTY